MWLARYIFSPRSALPWPSRTVIPTSRTGVQGYLFQAYAGNLQPSAEPVLVCYLNHLPAAVQTGSFLCVCAAWGARWPSVSFPGEEFVTFKVRRALVEMVDNSRHGRVVSSVFTALMQSGWFSPQCLGVPCGDGEEMIKQLVPSSE